MRRWLWSIQFRWLSRRGIRRRLSGHVSVRYRRALLEHFGARIGPDTFLEHPVVCLNAGRDFSGLSLGRGVYVGHNVVFDLKESIEIGDFVTLSMNVCLTTHLDVGTIPLAKIYPPRRGPIRIRENVYIGTGAIVLHGLTLGPHAMVAAGAVVVSDVKPGEVVGGVPARVLKRFEPGGP